MNFETYLLRLFSSIDEEYVFYKRSFHNRKFDFKRALKLNPEMAERFILYMLMYSYHINEFDCRPKKQKMPLALDSVSVIY